MREIKTPEMTPGYMICYSKDEMEREIKADIEALKKAAEFGGQVKDPSDPLLEVKEKLFKMMSDAHQRCDRFHTKNDVKRRKKFFFTLVLPFLLIGSAVIFYSQAIDRSNYVMGFILGLLIVCLPLFYCNLMERVFYHLVDLDKKYFNGQVHYCWQNGLPLKKN
ncbi:MAG: hypothetical protein J6M20_00675 [Clostridia bacterium]|nr:hypothetical protein [Clostridia bacterium]